MQPRNMQCTQFFNGSEIYCSVRTPGTTILSVKTPGATILSVRLVLEMPGTTILVWGLSLGLALQVLIGKSSH